MGVSKVMQVVIPSGLMLSISDLRPLVVEEMLERRGVVVGG